MRSVLFVVSSLSLAMVFMATLPAPAFAAQAAPSSKSSSILDTIRYDPARQGPLLLIGPFSIPAGQTAPARPDADTLDKLAESLSLRIVPVGSLTVLAPTTMTIIEEHPGKPDPYAGLRAEERFKVLLSLFSAAQWQLAGSALGIGAGDMNEQQRALWLGLLPEKVVLRQVKIGAVGTGGARSFDLQGDPKEFDPTVTRLRLVRKVEFSFSKAGTEDYGYSSGVVSSDEEERTLVDHRQASGDAPQDPSVTTLFGIPILRTVPSQLKPGQINFAAPALQKSVSLDGDMKTLGDLLGRVALVTGLDLAADRRLVGLPVCVRATPGQSARAGDILQSLCWSVTGAFRRVGSSTYLLTDDLKGIGARFARLNEWAEEAHMTRLNAMRDLLDTAAKNDPLSAIKFAPADPYALPPALLQGVDDAYHKARYTPGPEIKPSDLPDALQKSFADSVRWWAENNVNIRTDKVRVNTNLSAQFVLPGNLVGEAPFDQNIGSQYLQGIAVAKNTAAPAEKNTGTPAPPKPMPETLRKRVLLAQLPAEDKALTDLLAITKSKGFTEVWLHVMLDDRAAPERLKAAVLAGKKSGLSIGCVVSLLRGGGLLGPEDVNILGETGAQFAKRRAAGQPEPHFSYDLIAGWSLLDPNEAAQALTPLARIPGLSALALRATAAPGWTGEIPGGYGIPANSHLGYGVATRLACIHTEGFDPIDVNPYFYTLDGNTNLPFFPAVSVAGLWTTLSAFRLRENKQDLARVHAALRQVTPDLPLYLDDRASAFTEPNTRWYGRWDVAGRVPVNPVSAIESEGRAAAFIGSPEPLRSQHGWNGNPKDLARALGETAQEAAKSWQGLTLDMIGLTPPEALRMLGGLPELAARP